ncbi:ribosome hibernation-promoting factor, HPF/YfiA family [Roseateles toxinivorans]|uniref:Ribosomal subunit interface protein n=1 Tax=Roseateles toxinivorans TaxID=270368 RepID=A0A4R6QHR3_9BURK|nr:ribosome-associated translation inhibitor RaiA [Roseateles toxinivorans]TDP62082.1 ribosomal subunit interface protein [Roseateles toxinivorans]
MIVDIHGQEFTVTAALAEHVRRRLRFVLTRHSDRIQRVAVRVGDENGPRGGVDKYCRVQVHLRDARVAMVEDVGVDMYAAIDRAAERVGRVVVKHLDRAHPVRGAMRHFVRPARNRHEPVIPGHHQGDFT